MLKNRGVAGPFKRCLFVFLLMSCVCFSGASTWDSEIEVALKQHYRDRTLTLRHPLLSANQQYDSAGKLLSGGPEGPWTLYGGMQIDKVSLRPDKLLLTGHRTYFLYGGGQTATSYVPDKDAPLNLEVALEHPLASEQEAEAIMDSIFALTEQELLESVPVYWKPFVAARAGLKWEDTEPIAAESLIAASGGGRNRARLASAVSPPLPLNTPEPEFTQQARKRHIEGVVVLHAVVNEKGTVERVRIVRAAGMGLDEAAVAVMPKWKFSPALREGKPVSVEMKLEISFNLYSGSPMHPAQR